MKDTNLAQAIVLRLTTHPSATLRTFNLRGCFTSMVAVPDAFPQMVSSCSALEEVTLCLLTLHGGFGSPCTKLYGLVHP
jgi:hypothetical protein